MRGARTVRLLPVTKGEDAGLGIETKTDFRDVTPRLLYQAKK